MADRSPRPEISAMIEHIAVRWEKQDKKILKTVFPLLAHGESVSLNSISKAAGVNITEVERAVRAGRCDRDSDGRVTELFGVTLNPTDHKIIIDSTELFSCCALVAHMVPVFVGKDAVVESIDPVGNKTIRIKIASNKISSVDPENVVSTLVVTSLEKVLTDVGSAFCSHIKHFVSNETAEKFASEKDERYIVDMEEFHNTSQLMYKTIWV